MEEIELRVIGEYPKMGLLRTAIKTKDVEKVKEILLDALKKAKPEQRGFPVDSKVLQKTLPLLEKHFWFQSSLEQFLQNKNREGFSLGFYFSCAKLDYHEYKKFRELSEKYRTIAENFNAWWPVQKLSILSLDYPPPPSRMYKGNHPDLTFEKFLVRDCRNDFDTALRTAIYCKRYVFADEAIKRGAKLTDLSKEQLKAACTLGIFAAVKLYEEDRKYPVSKNSDVQSKQDFTNNSNLAPG